ncbi:EamA family transporter [Actinomadura algeriensis]|uniref:DME family drug/metabolite transporter n=1 Tax=Actinomadura algeriensis TaxID=1679523 RepID=A0ABR9JX69_9ACTN|nr:EamA family transporter [Actinomadura algeriensis]MBE1535175.1 DME family drug/metabolite transporter [Actinomadura algeriensis]
MSFRTLSFRMPARSPARSSASSPSGHASASGPSGRGLPGGGALPILAAASLWGTTGTVRTFADGASSLSVAAMRIVLGGLVLLASAALSRGGAARRGAGLRRLAADRRARPLVLLGAAAIIVYQTAFFVAAARTGVAVATIVTIGSAPAFAGLIGIAARRAAPSRRWTLATAAAVAGCALLVGGGADAGADPAGIALAALAGLAYAAYTTATSVLITRGGDERAVAGTVFGVAAVPLLPVLPFAGSGWILTGSGALIAGYLGVVATGGAYLLFARGLRTTPATAATTLTLAEPAVAAVLGVVLLGEHLGALALAGLALLAAALVPLVLPARK